MTDGGWAAARPDTAVLMLAASRGPDEDDVLTVLVRHEPGYVLVTVAGEVDFASAAGLRERLVTLVAAGRPLVADLDRVSFIDAAGLGALAGAARHATAHGSQPARGLRQASGPAAVRADPAGPGGAAGGEPGRDPSGGGGGRRRSSLRLGQRHLGQRHLGQRRRASGSTNHSPANRHVTNAVISPAVRPLET